MDSVNDNTKNQAWFFFILLFLFIDYGRPQDILEIGFVRLGMICTIVLFIMLLIRGHLDIFKEKQSRMIFYLVTLLVAFVPFAKNNHFAYITALNMALFLPFIFSVIKCVDSIGRLKIIVSIMIGLMAYISLYAVFHNGHGPGSYFKDENDMALYVNTYLPFCYFLLLNEKKNIKKIIYLICLILGFMAIFVSSSRGGFVGLVSMVFVAWLFSPKKFIALLLLALLLVGTFIFSMSGSYFDEMATIADIQRGTANERILSWQAAWKMFLDNPLGVGGGNFMVRFPEYQSEGFERGMWGRAAHSLWFTLLPELGVFGLIIYSRLLYFNFKDILFLRKIMTNKDKDLGYLHSLSLAFMASLAGFFASATFLSVLYYAHYYYLTALIVVSTLIAKDIVRNSLNEGVPPQTESVTALH